MIHVELMEENAEENELSLTEPQEEDHTEHVAAPSKVQWIDPA